MHLRKPLDDQETKGLVLAGQDGKTMCVSRAYGWEGFVQLVSEVVFM